MPELPEVECVVRSLQRLVGRKISKVEVLTLQLREKVQDALPALLEGRVIVAIERRAKYILFRLDQGVLIGHLGMTGKFVIDVSPAKHDHLLFHFDDGGIMRYNDVRKFGFVTYEANGEAGNKYIQNVGMEPLSSAFTADWLYGQLQRSRHAIKQFLLNQKIISGLGNIYAAEVLYNVGIHPLQASNTVSRKLAGALTQEIVRILEDSIVKGGSSISDYRDADNKQGSFQQSFNVYDRVIDPLGNPVEKFTQNGRTTFFCPAVQVLTG